MRLGRLWLHQLWRETKERQSEDGDPVPDAEITDVAGELDMDAVMAQGATEAEAREILCL